MPHLPLPTHPLTGLTALGWRKPRPGEDEPQPIWPILGGSEDAGGDTGPADGADDGGGEDQDSTDTDDQDGDRDGDDQDDGDEDLGEKGKKALRALRRENRQLKAQLRKAAAPAAPAKPSTDGDDDAEDADALRERLRQEARAEVWTERVEAAAVAAAANRLQNPQLAPRLLDLTDIPEDDKGRPDRTAISELIDELLEEDPYLAAPAKGSGRRFQGGADGGARKPAKKTAASLGEAISNRLAGTAG